MAAAVSTEMMQPEGFEKKGPGLAASLRASVSPCEKGQAGSGEFSAGPTISWERLRTVSSPQLKIFTAFQDSSKANSEFKVHVLPEAVDESIYQAEQHAAQGALGKKLASCWNWNGKEQHEIYGPSLAARGYGPAISLTAQKREDAFGDSLLCNGDQSHSLVRHNGSTNMLVPQGVWGGCKLLPTLSWDADATTVSAEEQLDSLPARAGVTVSPPVPVDSVQVSATAGLPHARDGSAAVVEYSGVQDKDKLCGSVPPLLRSRLGMQRCAGVAREAWGKGGDGAPALADSGWLGSKRNSEEGLVRTPMTSEGGGEADDELSDDGRGRAGHAPGHSSSDSDQEEGYAGSGRGWYQSHIDVKDLLPYVPSIILDDMFVPAKPSSSTADALRAGALAPCGAEPEAGEGAALRSFPYCSCMFAGVLIADVSGFSMLGELLYAYGDVGVEVFSEVLNYVLGAMISVVGEWDGHVTKIAGDALICVFPLKAHEAEEELAGRVCRCACRLACVLEEQRSRNTFGLRVHVGIALGVVSCVHLSTRTSPEEGVPESAGSTPARPASSAGSGALSQGEDQNGNGIRNGAGSLVRQGGQLMSIQGSQEDVVGGALQEGSPRWSPCRLLAVAASGFADASSRPRWRSFSSSGGGGGTHYSTLRRENSESDLQGDMGGRPGGFGGGDLHGAGGGVVVSDFSFCGAVVADASRAVELATAGQVVVSGVVAFMLRESRWSFEEIPENSAVAKRGDRAAGGDDASRACGNGNGVNGVGSVMTKASAKGVVVAEGTETANVSNGSREVPALNGLGTRFGGVRLSIHSTDSSSDSDSDEDCARYLNGVGAMESANVSIRPAVTLAHEGLANGAPKGRVSVSKSAMTSTSPPKGLEAADSGTAALDWRRKSFFLCVDHHASLRMLTSKVDSATSFCNRRAEVDAFMSEIMPHMQGGDGSGPSVSALLPSPTSPKSNAPGATVCPKTLAGGLERISFASSLTAQEGDAPGHCHGGVARLAPGFLLPKGVVSSLPCMPQANGKPLPSPGSSPTLGPTGISRQLVKLDLAAPAAGVAGGVGATAIVPGSAPLQPPSPIPTPVSSGHALPVAGTSAQSHFSKRLFTVLSPTCMPAGHKQLSESVEKRDVSRAERPLLPPYLRAECLQPYIPSYVLRALSFGSPMRPEMRQVITIFCCLSLAEAMEAPQGCALSRLGGGLNGSFSSSSGDEGSVRWRASFEHTVARRLVQRFSLDAPAGADQALGGAATPAHASSRGSDGDGDSSNGSLGGRCNGRSPPRDGAAARLAIAEDATERASEGEGALAWGDARGVLVGENKLRDRGDIDSEWIDGAHYVGGRMKESDLRRLNAAYAALSHSVARYKGTCRQFVRDDKGWTYIAVFGLVDSSQEDEYRAVLCALEMRDLLKALGVLVRLGVAAGKAFCGNVGSAARCEMAVVGRSVNLSARLACKAPQDGILVDESIHRYTWGHVQYKPLGKMKFKGKEESVDVYVPLCELPHRMQSGYRRVSYMGSDATIPDLGLVGRSQEISELMACLSSMRHLRRGRIILVEGEAGVGKTEMLRKLHLLARNMSIKVIMATGHALEEANAYHFYTQLLSQLLDLPVMMDALPGPSIAITRARLERKLEGLLDAATAPDVPLLALMFPDLMDSSQAGGGMGNASTLCDMSPAEEGCFQPSSRRTSRNGDSPGSLLTPASPAVLKGKHSPMARDGDGGSITANGRRLLNLMKGILTAVARRTPCVALVDDCRYMDSAFNRQLVAQLAALTNLVPIILVMSHTSLPMAATASESEPSSASPSPGAGTPSVSLSGADHKSMTSLMHAFVALASTKVLRLRCFTRVETGLFAMQVLNLARLPDELLAVVHARTGGNPLFVKELLLCIRKSKCMLVDDGLQALTVDFSSIKLSNNMRAILVSRLDRLEPFARDILKHAACIGLQFGERELLELLSWVYLNVCVITSEKLHAALEGLAALQILSPLPSFPARPTSPRAHAAAELARNGTGAGISSRRDDSLEAGSRTIRWESLDLPASPCKHDSADTAPDTGWMFCLSLLHDAVYGLMPASEKRRLHAFIDMHRKNTKRAAPQAPAVNKQREPRRSLDEVSTGAQF